ncbi:MAG: hypothetical protein HYT21_03100 [Candidatus Nealsonbacteria bacterium]|nr:hypothetical protein [Candidatus Nealsonbacteria bacterium]
MKNVELTKGRCAICRAPIDKKWGGDDPSLGTVCRNCPNEEVFRPENVEIVVQKCLRFDPLLGVYEYYFDWRGSRIMVNGKVGTINCPQADGDFVRFEDEETPGLGTFICGVGYWDLLRIYRAQDGKTEPPALNFEPYTPTKVKLLDGPILLIKVDRHENGNIRSVQIGSKSIYGGPVPTATELPNLPTLHAFANLYVRHKFELKPNYCSEGGFLGNCFEVRNAGTFTGGVGIYIREGWPGSAQEAVSTWMEVMRTLLRYDWRKFTLKTVEDIWGHYCRIQDVLLNIMSADELAEALSYCRNNKMTHCGSSY